MKIKDIVATVGEYQKGDEVKKMYRNVGELHQKPDGSQFILLDKIFNPGALAMPGKDKILLNLYEPRDKTDQHAPQQQKTEHSDSRTQTSQSKPTRHEDLNDDIPF